MSSVNVPDRFVPAWYKSDEVSVMWKSSEPEVTLVKYAPLEVEKATVVVDCDPSEDADVVGLYSVSYPVPEVECA